MEEKRKLRSELRARRKAHVAALPDATRSLLFRRPPSPVAALAGDGATVGLYHAAPQEAPTRALAQWFLENGHIVALPWFAGRDAPMQFREWRDPYADSGLEPGPYAAAQPSAAADEVTPSLLIVPLLGFTASGQRIGQGGGHYDRWLAAHPGVTAIGLAWDCQLAKALPLEPHDHRLAAVVTPTRIYHGEA